MDCSASNPFPKQNVYKRSKTSSNLQIACQATAVSGISSPLGFHGRGILYTVNLTCCSQSWGYTTGGSFPLVPSKGLCMGTCKVNFSPQTPCSLRNLTNPSARIRSFASHLLPGSLPASLTTAAVPCLSVCLLLVPSLYCSPGSPELYCSCCFLLLAHPG